MKLCDYNARKLEVSELPILSKLFQYNDLEEMLVETGKKIAENKMDIYCLFKENILLGELRVSYENEDEDFARRGVRAYLNAFRVDESMQNKGLGKHLMQYVIEDLEQQGYVEFTIGVEDGNARAKHIYEQFGFLEKIGRKEESYQDDSYEYDLLLRKSPFIDNMTAGDCGYLTGK